jgi:hypothetical protein
MLLVTDLTSKPVFEAMPSLNAGRCWLFAANEDLSPRFNELSAKVDGFLSQWAAHGLPVEGGSALICGHFLAIAEGLAGETSSGCSQDALRGMVQGLEKAFGTPLIAGGRIFYREADGKLVVTTRTAFQAAARSGALGPETWVFDTLVQAAGDLRVGRFLAQVKDTWHQKLIPLAHAN